MNCSQQTNGTTNMATLLQKNCIKTLSVNNGVVVVGTAVPNAASSATTANIQPMIANASHVQPIQAFQYQQLQTVPAQPQYIIYNPNDGTMFRPVTTATVPNIPTTFITNNTAIYQPQQQPQPIITQSNILPKIGTIASNATTATPRVLNIVGPRKAIHSVNVAQLSKMPKLTAVATAPKLVSAPALRATTKAMATKVMPIINSSNQHINLGTRHTISTVAATQMPPTTTVVAVSTNGAIVKRIDNITPMTSASLTNFSDRTRMHTHSQPALINSVNRNVVISNRSQYTAINPITVTNHTIPAVQRSITKTTTVTATAPTPTPTPMLTPMPTARQAPPLAQSLPLAAAPARVPALAPTATNHYSTTGFRQGEQMLPTRPPSSNKLNGDAFNSAGAAPVAAPAQEPFRNTAVDESRTNNNARTTNAQSIDVDTGDSTTNAAEEEVEPEPEIDIVINNVVCSFSVRCHLNLREIALNGKNVEFRRENGMVTMKLRRPYTTASIWSSGRITCTGATSEDQAKIAARRYARVLQSLDFPVRFNNFRVVNVLGTCSMPWAIKIVSFSEKYKHEASYEPELHPGVTYKLRAPKATLKIFSTGSITVTAGSVADVQSAIEHIFPLVYEFRKKRVPAEVVQPVETFDPDNDDDVHDIMGLGGERGGALKKPAKKKAVKRKYPFGLAENDPDEDMMAISDVESDVDDDNDEF